MLTKDKLSKVFEGKVAVFIDAANLEHSVADLGSSPPRFNTKSHDNFLTFLKSKLRNLFLVPKKQKSR